MNGKRKTIFWDVDTQVDFMDPQGALYVPGAETITENLGRLAAFAREHGVLVVSSMCAHREGDPEFAEYPPHCLVGTPGQKKVPETVLAKHFVVPPEGTELPEDLSGYEQVIIEKRQLDVFGNPSTAALLERLGRSLRVVLYGVVTEICVDRAARGLIQHGAAITVVRDAVRHLDEKKARATLETVQRCDGRVATTREILEELGREMKAA